MFADFMAMLFCSAAGRENRRIARAMKLFSQRGYRIKERVRKPQMWSREV
jgi:hypothetical protein